MDRVTFKDAKRQSVSQGLPYSKCAFCVLYVHKRERVRPFFFQSIIALVSVQEGSVWGSWLYVLLSAALEHFSL